MCCHGDCLWQGHGAPRNSARPQQGVADFTGMKANNKKGEGIEVVKEQFTFRVKRESQNKDKHV